MLAPKYRFYFIKTEIDYLKNQIQISITIINQMLQLQYKKQNKTELLNSGMIVDIINLEKRKKCTKNINGKIYIGNSHLVQINLHDFVQ